MTARRVDSPIPGFITGDGQRGFLREGDTLYSTDALGNNKRIVHTFPSEGGLRRAEFSRDLSLVLIQEGPSGGPFSLTLIRSDGTGQKNLGQVNRDTSGSFSWDNRYVVLAEPQKDGASHIVKLTLADGRRQEVSQRDHAVVQNAQFAPDGRFIAFAEAAGGSNKVLAVPSTGGEPIVVAEDSGLVDWTRDGRYLAVNSGRDRGRALYLIPVKDGRAIGAPVFIRNGAIESGGTLPSGALLYSTMTPPGTPAVFVGSLVQGAGDLLHGLDSRAHHVPAPLVEESPGPLRRVVFPELLKGFFKKVSADGLQVVAEQIPYAARDSARAPSRRDADLASSGANQGQWKAFLSPTRSPVDLPVSRRNNAANTKAAVMDGRRYGFLFSRPTRDSSCVSQLSK
jgi:hypothetical protein